MPYSAPWSISGGINPWYVTGLVESAGAFTFSRSDRNISLYFSLKVTDGEGSLLSGIQTYFDGAGRIYRHSSAGRATSPSFVHYYRVSKLDELGRVTEHFDEYPLRGRKANTYRVWREMVQLKRSRFRKPDRERLNELCIALSLTSARGHKGT